MAWPKDTDEIDFVMLIAGSSRFSLLELFTPEITQLDFAMLDGQPGRNELLGNTYRKYMTEIGYQNYI